jgi:hypothetical protein
MSGLAGRAARAFPRRGIGEVMSRPGRKRKNGPRHPGGQLKKEKQPDDRIRTSRQPHRRALAHEMRASGADDLEVKKACSGEEAESPIGRLWLTGKLAAHGDHDSQAARDRYDAGTMYAQIVGAYRSVIEAPNGGGGSGRGFGCLELLCRLAPENCECERRKARYDRAFEALQRIGMRALKAVNRLAVHRETIAEEELVYLVGGLEGLRRIFGLTASRKSKHYRNAK